MRSPEKIDSEQANQVKAANKAVAELSDCGFRWWDYSVSHRTFTLLVGDASARESNVVIGLAACEYISGPVDWIKPHKLEVIFNCDRTKAPNFWEFVVQDNFAGLKVVAGVFEWRKNYNLLRN